MIQIRLNPDMMIRADAIGEFELLLLHALFTASSHRPGSGLVYHTDLQADYCDGRIVRLFSRRRLRHYLRLGEGVFWRTTDSAVVLRSRRSIAKRYGYLSTVDAMIDPAAVISGTNGPARWASVRAHVYGLWHAARRRAENPISRDSIHEATAIPRARQRRYERRAGVKVTHQYEYMPLDGRDPAYEAARAQDAGVHVWIGRVDGEPVLFRQIGNCYEAEAELASQSSRRRMNRYTEVDLRTIGDAGYQRIYFGDSVRERQAAARAICARAGDEKAALARERRGHLWTRRGIETS